jgi:hypothetical protein
MIPSYFNYRESVNDFVDNYEIKKTLIELSCECNGMIERYFKEHTFEENIFELSTIHFQERFREDILYWSTFYQKAQLPFPIIITDTKTFKTESFIQHFNRAEYFNKILSEKNNIYISSYASPFIVVLNKVLLKMFLDSPNIILEAPVPVSFHSQFIRLFYMLFQKTQKVILNSAFRINNLFYGGLYSLFDHSLRNKQIFLKNNSDGLDTKKGTVFSFTTKSQFEKRIYYFLEENYDSFLRNCWEHLIEKWNFKNIHKSLFRNSLFINNKIGTTCFLKYKDLFLDVYLLCFMFEKWYCYYKKEYQKINLEKYVITILDYMYEFEKNKIRFSNLISSFIINNGIEI